MPVHFMLQKKGGVGKSYLTSMFLQYLQEHDIPYLGIDLDPTTPTISSIKGLKTKRVELLKSDRNSDALVINKNGYVEFSNVIFNDPTNTHYVVDCGASGYNDLLSFLQTGQVIDLLLQMNVPVYFHTILQGGNNALPTLDSMLYLIKTFPDIPMIVWINGYHQDIEFKNEEGLEFQQTKVYRDNVSHIISVVDVPPYGFFSDDAERMFASKRTIADLVKNGFFSIIQSHGLCAYRAKLWERIDKLMADIEVNEYSVTNSNPILNEG